MKTCSKCKCELEEACFVKSPRYSDGLYPSCKECRKKIFKASLIKNPLCRRCKTVPHQPTNAYCYECHRVMRGQKTEAKFRRDVTNKLWCSKCKQRPRREYSNYCYECGNQALVEWHKENTPIEVTPESRRKASARHYINTLFKRGKIRRQPCQFCGAPSVHFHHLDYNDRTLNVQHVCLPCHVRLEREKRKQLTISTSGAIASP